MDDPGRRGIIGNSVTMGSISGGAAGGGVESGAYLSGGESRLKALLQVLPQDWFFGENDDSADWCDGQDGWRDTEGAAGQGCAAAGDRAQPREGGGTERHGCGPGGRRCDRPGGGRAGVARCRAGADGDAEWRRPAGFRKAVHRRGESGGCAATGENVVDGGGGRCEGTDSEGALAGRAVSACLGPGLDTAEAELFHAEHAGKCRHDQGAGQVFSCRWPMARLRWQMCATSVRWLQWC
jgi:hypothetical protein